MVLTTVPRLRSDTAVIYRIICSVVRTSSALDAEPRDGRAFRGFHTSDGSKFARLGSHGTMTIGRVQQLCWTLRI